VHVTGAARAECFYGGNEQRYYRTVSLSYLMNEDMDLLTLAPKQRLTKLV
jgi:hypothetical protein